MTPCPACAEHLETIRALGETCDRLVREREEARAGGFAAGVEAAARLIEAKGVVYGSTNELRPRLEGDRGGLEYAVAIRALTEMQRGRGAGPAVATSSRGGARLHPPAEAGE